MPLTEATVLLLILWTHGIWRLIAPGLEYEQTEGPWLEAGRNLPKPYCDITNGCLGLDVCDSGKWSNRHLENCPVRGTSWGYLLLGSLFTLCQKGVIIFPLKDYSSEGGHGCLCAWELSLHPLSLEFILQVIPTAGALRHRAVPVGGRQSYWPVLVKPKVKEAWLMHLDMILRPQSAGPPGLLSEQTEGGETGFVVCERSD